MKVVLISILKLGLRLLYAPMKLFKTKNQIVYLSRQRNQKDIDIELLEKAINQKSPETKQVFRLKMIDDGISSKIKYLFYIVGDMYYLATSRIAVLDTYSIPVSCLKHKKIGEAIFSNNGLVGIVIYLAGVAFCVSFMGGPSVLPNSVIFSIMGVCALLLFIKEIPIGIIDKHPDWKPESVLDFVLQNVFELIEYILSYFSNTVSFLRVGAFVIVHASMMMVVFTLGADGSNIPVVIIGNIVVIALEGLLTGIQGLRLEFYEMFSRFYDGGGRAFEPVRLQPSKDTVKYKRSSKRAKAKVLANKN